VIRRTSVIDQLQSIMFLCFFYDVTKVLSISFPVFSIPIELEKHSISIPMSFLLLCFSYPAFKIGLDYECRAGGRCVYCIDTLGLSVFCIAYNQDITISRPHS
jgi:hypothetical protein